METRREFLKKIIAAGSFFVVSNIFFIKKPLLAKVTERSDCTLYRAVNGLPEQNMVKVIELMGGIEKIVEAGDVVVIKPSVQWWNQGASNLSALKTFVDLIMNYRGGFKGEVVIAENCHRGSTPWNSLHSGWARKFKWNSGIQNIYNMNDLSALLKKKYRDQFSLCHWIDVAAGSKRIFGPEEGTGYVYCDGSGGVPLISLDNNAGGDDHRVVIMSYPIFKTDKGTIVDFKNGIWERGAYTEQPLRFINFAALNHHSTYASTTSAIKNYMGISDLSGGPDPQNGGRLKNDYYNFHSFPFNKWAPGPVSGMLGKEISVFMKTIRKADLNITTAEWIGIASRTEPPVVNTRAVLACTDPVALDYHATKYILFPNSKLIIHDPDNQKSPLHQYLVECMEGGGGIFNERYIAVKSYDYNKSTFQRDNNLMVIGKKKWGHNFKIIFKYLMLRFLRE